MTPMSMPVPTRRAALALAAAAVLAACDDAAGPAAIDDADAEAVAAYMTETAPFANVSFDERPESDARFAVTTVVDFSRTVDCPSGGVYVVAGQTTKIVDRQAGTASADLDAMHTLEGCTFERRGHTFTLDGDVAWLAAGAWNLPGDGSGRDLVAYDASKVGSVTITRDGAQRVCEIDVTKTYDDEDDSMTIEGTVCGTEILIVRDRTPNES